MQPITDPAILAGYLTDASNLPGHAEALYRPRDAAGVAAVLRRCQQDGTPLTVTAKRTSTTGASVPMGGALLSTELLTDATSHATDATSHATSHATDARDATSRWVGAGVLLGDFQRQVEAEGLFFPPDPTSRLECSVGGAIACNASGARTYRYGPVRPWVEAVEFVTPTGEIRLVTRETPLPWPVPVWREPAVKTAAGYCPADNLLDLIIGAEGTLGVITAAKLRLIPLPAHVLTFFAYFPDEPSLLSFLADARSLGGRWPDPPATAKNVGPRCIEFFDRRALDMIRDRLPEVPAAHAALLIEVEHDGEAPLEFWFGLLTDRGALLDDTIVAEEETGRLKLQRVRHALPATVNEIITRNGVQKVGTDFSVPDAALPEMLRAYDAVPMAAVCFGHIGNNHLHMNLLPRDQAELVQARAIYLGLARQAVALGGSVSGEHGIGRLKKAHLALMVPEEVREGWRRLRRAADPGMILGRGVMLD